MKRIRLFVLILCGFECVNTAFAARTDQTWYVTPKIGYSLFTGILGLEVQRDHWAFDAGYFPSGGVRFYFKPQGHSWFTGVYGSGYGYDDNETIDGIAYTHKSAIQGGAAGGYRWFWRSRWSLELGLAIGYGETRWTNAYVERIEKGIRVNPLLTAGFSF